MLIAYTFLPIAFFLSLFPYSCRTWSRFVCAECTKPMPVSVPVPILWVKVRIRIQNKKRKRQREHIDDFCPFVHRLLPFSFLSWFYRVAICRKEFPAKLEEITQSNWNRHWITNMRMIFLRCERLDANDDDDESDANHHTTVLQSAAKYCWWLFSVLAHYQPVFTMMVNWFLCYNVS